MRILSRALVVALALALAGCGSYGTISSPESEHVRAPTKSERSYLEDAILPLQSSDAGIDFTFGVGAEDLVIARGSGTFEWEPERWNATTTFDLHGLSDSVPEGSEMGVLSTGDLIWMQMSEWEEPRAGCWLLLGPGEVPLGMQAMRPGQPVFVSLLGGLGAGPRHGDQMSGTLDLAYAVNLVSGEMLRDVDLRGVDLDQADVPTELAFRDGQLTGISISGDDLTAALVESGGTFPDGTVTEGMVRHVRLTVGYDLPTGPPSGFRPPPYTTFEVDDEEGC